VLTKDRKVAYMGAMDDKTKADEVKEKYLEAAVDAVLKGDKPATAETGMMLEAARDRGLLVGRGGLLGNVIRMSPPLNISKADVDEATRILEDSFAALPQS